MINLTVNCIKMHCRLTDLGCLKQQAIREECQSCERRDKSIKYVGLLSEFVIDQNVRGGRKAAITKQKGRVASVATATDCKSVTHRVNTAGSIPAPATKQGGAKRSLAEKTPIMAGDSTLEVVASVTCKAPPAEHINCSVKKPFWRPKGFTRQNEVRNGWPKGKPRVAV